MAASNRAKLITKLHTELKKRYDVPPAQPSRPLLEHLLYACLLEDCPHDLADEGLAKCEQDFFDWNEVRVTTVTELAQVLSNFPEPTKSAKRLKDNLQSVFEEFYNFDIDHLKKENLGKAVAKFEAMPSMTPFVLGYTIQHGLAGHSIPIDYSAMVVMLSTGIATQAEASNGKVPGLERAIPKNKGMEFSSLLHSAAVALNSNSSDKKARQLLDAVAKGSSQALDDWFASRKAAIRRVKKRRKEEVAAEKAAAEQAAIEKAAAEALKAEKAAKKAARAAAKAAAAAAPPQPAPAKPPAKAPAKKAPAKKATETKSVAKKSASSAKTTKKTATKKTSAASKATKKSVAAKSATKATAKKTTKKSATKKPTAKKATSKKSAASKSSTAKKSSKKSSTSKSVAKKKPTSKKSTKKSSNRKLSKRKPR